MTESVWVSLLLRIKTCLRRFSSPQKTFLDLNPKLSNKGVHSGLQMFLFFLKHFQQTLMAILNYFTIWRIGCKLVWSHLHTFVLENMQTRFRGGPFICKIVQINTLYKVILRHEIGLAFSKYLNSGCLFFFLIVRIWLFVCLYCTSVKLLV